MHSILITAYKSPDQLAWLIGMFPEDHFNVYVHIDQKSKLEVDDLIAKTGRKQHIRFYKKYRINWGGRNHLKAILWLAEKAIEDSRNHFFHLITGQDLPIKPISYFLNELDASKDYLQTVPYPVSYLPDGAKDWFEYYLLYDVMDSRKYIKYIRLFRNIQIKLGIKRDFSGYFANKFYGSTYWSLTRDTLQHVITYTKDKPGFLHRLKYTFCAEEIYFTTIILNSPFASNVVNHNLRYIKWERDGKTGSPKILEDTDLDDVINSDNLFARKFEFDLMKKFIDKYIVV